MNDREGIDTALDGFHLTEFGDDIQVDLLTMVHSTRQCHAQKEATTG